MLTEVELRIVEKFAFIATTTLSFPFDWDARTRALIPTKSRVKYLLVLGNFGLSAFYVCFQILRLIPGIGQNYRGASKSPELVACLIIHFYFIVVQLMLTTIQWHSIKNVQGWCLWFNQIRRFNRNAGLLHLGKEHLEPNKREIFLRLVQLSLIIIGMIFPAAFPLKRNNPNFIFSALPEDWKSFNVLLFFAVFEAYNIVRGCIFHLVLAFFVFIHIFTIDFWLNKARADWIREEDDHSKIFRIFASLSLLNNSWNHSVAAAFGIFKILLELVTVVGIYATLRLYSQMDFALYIVSPGIVLTVLFEDTVVTAAMANIFEKSKELKSQLKGVLILYTSTQGSGNEGIHVQKRSNALKPIQCKAVLFYFERRTKLVVIGLLMNMTAYALLST